MICDANHYSTTCVHFDKKAVGWLWCVCPLHLELIHRANLQNTSWILSQNHKRTERGDQRGGSPPGRRRVGHGPGRVKLQGVDDHPFPYAHGFHVASSCTWPVMCSSFCLSFCPSFLTSNFCRLLTPTNPLYDEVSSFFDKTLGSCSFALKKIVMPSRWQPVWSVNQEGDNHSLGSYTLS